MTPKTALVLCGGLGTRLRPSVGDVQKTLVDAGGEPFLERLLSWAARAGVRRAVLCAGYKGESVRDWASGRTPPPEVVLSLEPRPLGTGGALGFAAPHVDAWPVLVLNGDSFCPVELSALAAVHLARGAAVTMTAVPAGGRKDAGTITMDASGRVSSFCEKKDGIGGWINAGVYIFGREVFSAIPAGASSLERDVLPGLLERGVFALRTELPLWDIGTPERLAEYRRTVTGGRP
ncbi:MAG: NTP transferase domain-containing protein [Elusimicrobia bacterium]|nr:NTP transferase domain-containing protein [Elusimicrobiota bacterium]